MEYFGMGLMAIIVIVAVRSFYQACCEEDKRLDELKRKRQQKRHA